MRPIRAMILLSGFASVLSCSAPYKAHIKEYVNEKAASVPDYAQLYYWAAHPYKWDPSDSLPTAIRKGEVRDTTVDVFFIHPTSWYDKETPKLQPDGGDRWNADVNNAELNALTDYTSILNQASAFNHYRVFAPRYRQAHLRSFYIADSISRPIFETAYADVRASFEYYLSHYNNGRPVIIAAHSQGTVHAARLLKEYFENKPLGDRLVCAYLIGMPIRTDLFSTVRPCSDSSATGCFVSWRTFKEGHYDSFVEKETFKAFVVNPLTWEMNEETAPRKLNKGSILYKFNKLKLHNVSARVSGNVLWSTKPRFFGNILLTRKNYHIADINLFWMNIRDNVRQRVEQFRKARS